MTNAEFMNKLERNILIPGIARGIFTTKVQVPVRLQKLHKSDFGSFIGNVIEGEQSVMVIDYYGFLKRSAGFIAEVKDHQSRGFELRSIDVPVAYFAGIKVEHLSDYAPELLNYFPSFKRFLVKLRKFD
jgi:hypothetical protein